MYTLNSGSNLWQGGIQVGIVGSGSYEQSWRAIPTQRPGPRDHLPATPASTGAQHPDGQGIRQYPIQSGSYTDEDESYGVG